MATASSPEIRAAPDALKATALGDEMPRDTAAITDGVAPVISTTIASGAGVLSLA